MPKLYYTPSSCSAASFIIAHHLGAKVEAEVVDIRTHLTASGVDFYTINPHGNVPTLVLDDGTVLNECSSVLFAIAGMKPDSDIVPMPCCSTGFLQTLNELSFIGTELHATYGPLFNPALAPDVRAAQVEKLLTKFKRLDAKLAGKEFLVGGKFGLADAYAYIVTSWHKYVGVSLDAFPNVTAFAARVGALPTVQSAHALMASSPAPTHTVA